MQENLKFVAVGHVDHGKSTLIGRLLFDTESLPPEKMDEVRRVSQENDGVPEFAFVMDFLEEERVNRVTIDTAQIFFSTDTRDYTIIDAPGHKQFLKNMITGSTQAEAALLLIDAEEGLQEQTHRHAYMLSLLGVKQIMVVINKMDLVDYSQDRFNELSADITAKLKELDLEVAPEMIIPISAKYGDNVAKDAGKLSWFSGMTLLIALDELKASETLEDGVLRFPLQDVYDFDDEKILAGKIVSGTIKEGQRVIFHPSGKSSSVTKVMKWNQDCPVGIAGDSIGIVIADQGPVMNAIKRGEVACPEAASPTIGNTLVATVFWMNGEPLTKGDTLEFKCATQQVECTVKKITNRLNTSTLEVISKDSEELLETEVAKLTLKMNNHIVTDSFDVVAEMGRFVLMRDNDTVAGGIIG